MTGGGHASGRHDNASRTDAASSACARSPSRGGKWKDKTALPYVSPSPAEASDDPLTDVLDEPPPPSTRAEAERPMTLPLFRQSLYLPEALDTK
jgi:hypothetical protein